MKYTVDYFLNKFQVIPETLFIVASLGDPGGPRCALGHCLPNGEMYTEESVELGRLLNHKVVLINNGIDDRYPQPTPKQRIIAALRDIKAMSDGQAARKDITSDLAVLPVEEKLDLIKQSVTP